MSTPILEVENVTFRYDMRLEVDTISNVSFTVEKGKWLAIVGHNGCGKSTLAQLLVGLLKPQKGRISVGGLEMNHASKWEIRRNIGLVFQNPDNQFIGTTVQDDVAFGLENLNMPYEEMKKRVNQALTMVGMSNYHLHDPSRLSGGQKQRIAIAGLLALSPTILVLDEAFVMLDPKSRRELLSSLKDLKEKENLTIISITHDMNEAAASDQILVMNAGEIVRSGPPEQVFSQEPELEPPFAERLRRELIKRNRAIPNAYMTETELERWLWKSCVKV